MLKKSTTKTVIVENTFTLQHSNPVYKERLGEENLATALVRKVNDEEPLIALTLNIPGRKRGLTLNLDPDQIADFAGFFAAIVEDTQS